MGKAFGSAKTTLAALLLINLSHGLIAQTAKGEVPVRGIVELEQLCEGGQAAACATLSTRYEFGRGLSRDPDEAERLFRRAEELHTQHCTGGDEVSCRHLLLMFYFQVSSRAPHNLDAMRERFSAACSKKMAVGCIGIALFLFLAESHEDAKDVYREACNAGDALGCYFLNEMIIRGSTDEEELEQVVGLAKKSCDLGFFWSCRDYLKLMNPFKSDDVAASLLRAKESAGEILSRSRAACAGGNAVACWAFAVMLDEGTFGFDQDNAEALRIYWRACEFGMPMGCEEAAELEKESR